MYTPNIVESYSWKTILPICAKIKLIKLLEIGVYERKYWHILTSPTG